MGEKTQRQSDAARAEVDHPRNSSTAEVKDPFLEFLKSVEIDDEPVTDEDRAAIEAGWNAYLLGHTVTLEEFLERLSLEDDSTPTEVP